MLRTQVLNVSQNETEKDISLTRNIRRVRSTYVWVCKFESACVCGCVGVCVRCGKSWGWMNRQHDGEVERKSVLEGAVKGARNV